MGYFCQRKLTVCLYWRGLVPVKECWILPVLRFFISEYAKPVITEKIFYKFVIGVFHWSVHECLYLCSGEIVPVNAFGWIDYLVKELNGKRPSFLAMKGYTSTQLSHIAPHSISAAFFSFRRKYLKLLMMWDPIFLWNILMLVGVWQKSRMCM